MLNKVMIIGRLGRDPELRYSQSGSPVCTLNIATDESYTDNSGQKVEKAATATVWTVPSGTASWCSRKRRRTAPST